MENVKFNKLTQETVFYNEKGQISRKDGGPAVIKGDGTQIWYKDGKITRPDNQPAVVYPDDRPNEYFNNGQFYGIEGSPLVTGNRLRAQTVMN